MQLRYKEWIVPVSIGILSFGCGFLCGKSFVKRKLAEEIAVLEAEQTLFGYVVEERDRQMDRAIQNLNRVIDKIKDESEAIFDANRLIMERNLEVFDDEKESLENHPSGGRRVENLRLFVTEGEEEPMVTIFDESTNDEWDYELEEKNRSPEHPYIVHRDEFFSNEADGYTQTTLMYYVGDHILCDEDSVPIHDPDRLVGKLEFGHGSQDQNVVYIRNDRLMAEYEVLRDGGFYQVEVLGAQIERDLSADDLKHGIPRFRME